MMVRRRERGKADGRRQKCVINPVCYINQKKAFSYDASGKSGLVKRRLENDQPDPLSSFVSSTKIYPVQLEEHTCKTEQ